MDQQMMMMMMMKNNFPPNVMQPTDACANAPSESQQRLLQQVQHTTRINQFQSPTSFGTGSHGAEIHVLIYAYIISELRT